MLLLAGALFAQAGPAGKKAQVLKTPAVGQKKLAAKKNNAPEQQVAPAEAALENIETLSHTWSVRTGLQARTLQLNIQPGTSASFVDGSNSIQYVPQIPVSVLADLEYKGYGISLSRNITQQSSATTDIQLYHYTAAWGIDLFYQDYARYWLNNPQNYFPGTTGTYLARPDISLNAWGTNVYYQFFGTFSYRAAFKQSERQKGLAGGFLVMVSARKDGIQSDSALVPQGFADIPGFRAGDFVSLSASPGVAFTLTLFDLYLSASFFWGPGLMYKAYQLDTTTLKQFGVSTKYNWRIATGYNGDTIFLMLAFITDYTDTRQYNNLKGVGVMPQLGFLELSAGVRF